MIEPAAESITDYHARGQTLRADMVRALRRYADHHIETGSFLRAALENDLSGAVERADDGNAGSLAALVVYLVNEMPEHCHGSPAAVAWWIEEGKRKRAAADA